MKKMVATTIIATSLLVTGITAQAAPPQKDLDAYLTSVNMTQQELDKYLMDYMGWSIDEFESISELKFISVYFVSHDRRIR
ncbi:processed acidic surface protein [Gottfriedia sp. NPDC057991]|uniref:processed acidic surface protein n=1 Tax=Gottfriedia sp. NPDC057991 TaxID=3346298 RepID=UPI0036DA79A1